MRFKWWGRERGESGLWGKRDVDGQGLSTPDNVGRWYDGALGGWEVEYLGRCEVENMRC